MRRALAVLLLTVVMLPALRAQTAQKPLRDLATVTAELERIKSDLEIVKAQLAQVLRLLNQRQAQSARPPLKWTSARERGRRAVTGTRGSPATIVEFSDYQCPFCQRFFAMTLPALKKEYIDAGKVRYVFRDHPMDQLHPYARKAAEAAHCAGDQGKYWEMHDVLFQNPSALGPPQLSAHAGAIGLDGPAFDACLSSGKHAARVERGVTDGAAAGVQGTPGFVIGVSKGGGVIQGTPVRGAQPLDTFRQVIDRALTMPLAPAP